MCIRDRGRATAEVIGVNRGAAPDADDRPLLHRFVHAGELAEGWTGPEAVTRAAERHAASLRELPASVGRLQPGDPAIPTIFLED